ncbi:MAG: serine hydrolase, partial [Candidatus Saccharimonadales bacterium]|nr:serine hydrolase [Candidatus Saccharimonadales bacterium]
LQTLLADYEQRQLATMGIAVWPLDGSAMVGINQSTTFKSASMYKLFVAYETLLRIDEGELSLDQPTGYDAGSQTIGSCLEVMITVSDNPCGRALRKVLDVTEKPLPRLAELGFTGTNLAYDYPTTSAQDIALLCNKLYNQEDLSKASNQLLLTHLKNQQINDRIPIGLPSGTEVAHKTGDLEGFSHDGGIVYTRSGDYVLVILGGPWQSDLGTIYANYANLTSLIHDYLTGS